MNAILIYASCYGTTKRYAEELSRRTGWPAASFKELPDLSPYDTVVHLGGLYAEKLLGLNKTLKALPEGARLIVVTVGLGDPSSPASSARLKANVKKALPAGVEAECFHLRGAMDMEKLSFRHKMMMKGFLAVMSRTAAGKSGGMTDVSNGPVDFVDFSALAPLEERLKE